MDDAQAFRDAFARRVREGVRRYMERNDLWRFGPTDLVRLMKAEGASVTSWTVQGWLSAEYVPKYELGTALARVLDMDYGAMMAPVQPEGRAVAPQSAVDATTGIKKLPPGGRRKLGGDSHDQKTG